MSCWEVGRIFTFLNIGLFGLMYSLVQVQCFLGESSMFASKKSQLPSCSYTRACGFRLFSYFFVFFLFPRSVFSCRAHKSYCDASQSELLDSVLPISKKKVFTGIAHTPCRRSPFVMNCSVFCFGIIQCYGDYHRIISNLWSVTCLFLCNPAYS